MDIIECREQIDRINNDILRLFCERMTISEAVAAYKKENNLPIFDPVREKAILDSVEAKTPDEFAKHARVLFTILMDLSRSHQAKMLGLSTNKTDVVAARIANCKAKTPPLFPTRATVACQGLSGAYSAIACDTLFLNAEKTFLPSFEDVFSAVQNGSCEFGVLPIENSTYGTVIDVYDLMKRYKFNIVRCVRVKIQHCLLAKSGTNFADIKTVYSHPQALGQCANFLRENPQITAVECKNTAVAAKKVADSGDPTVAAIASESCAELYDLQKIDMQVQNNSKNFTRFICISRDEFIFPEANKISVTFTLQHVPSALFGILSRFAAYGVNITKIESRPIEGSDFEFRFYFDFEASTDNPNAIKLLQSMENDCESFTFLGSYLEF